MKKQSGVQLLRLDTGGVVTLTHLQLQIIAQPCAPANTHLSVPFTPLFKPRRRRQSGQPSVAQRKTSSLRLPNEFDSYARFANFK
jgi:hypothetical protein